MIRTSYISTRRTDTFVARDGICSRFGVKHLAIVDHAAPWKIWLYFSWIFDGVRLFFGFVLPLPYARYFRCCRRGSASSIVHVRVVFWWECCVL